MSQTLLVWANVHLAPFRQKHPEWALSSNSDPSLDDDLRLALATVSVVVVVLSSELHSEGVVELLHGNLAVPVVVESSHQGVFLVVCDEDVQSKQVD